MFLFRILKAVLAIIMILTGLTILGFIYLFRNPEKINQGINYVIEKSLSGRAHQESEEFFLQGIQTIRIDAPHMDIKLRYDESKNLKVQLIGQVSVFDSGPFITSQNINSELTINLQTHVTANFRMNINGQEVRPKAEQITVEIVIPKSYKKSVSVLSHSGQVNVTIPKDVMLQVNADSRSGEIINTYKPEIKDPTDVRSVGSLNIRSNLGNITVQTL